jgi:hypothetical protein
MKNEFNRWLKKHWDTFAGEDASSIYYNIITIGNEYIQYSGIQYPFINCIPLFGGFQDKSERSSGEVQLGWMKENHVRFPIGP